MSGWTSLVVGIDFTPCAASALRQAIRIAERSQAALQAVHVIESLVVTDLEEALGGLQTDVRASLGITDNLYGVMLLIVLFMLVAGFVVDATVLIIMLTPIFLPLVRELGGDPVHFGLVFIVSATIGNFTPPVGAAMYAVCSILRCSIGDYTRESLPLFGAVALATLVLVLFPQAVLLIPNLIFGH